MAPLSKSYKAKYKDGQLQRYGVNGGSTIYAGSLVVLGTDGYLQAAAANCSNGKFVGIAMEGTLYGVTNVADNDQSILVFRKGIFYYKVTGAGVAIVGADLYVTDDNNLTATRPANGIPVAKFVSYDGESGYGWVEPFSVDTPEITQVKVLKVPFTQSKEVKDTGIDLQAGLVILEAFVEVTSAVAGSSIDVGTINAVEGGTEDGFIDGASCATAGKVQPIVSADAAASLTVGDYLSSLDLKDANGKFAIVKKVHVTDGVMKSLTYTTSDHAVAGNIYIVYLAVN